MLTRSPTPATSATSSPTFHYAPLSSPRRSPHQSAVVSRRQLSSSSSIKSPLIKDSTSRISPVVRVAQQSTPPKYVGVDAGTQYSPMQPADYSAPRLQRPENAEQKGAPPAPKPQPMNLPGGEEEAAAHPPATLVTAISQKPQVLKADPPISPNKRRSSPGLDHDEHASPALRQLAENVPKRPRPAAVEAKVLKQRYELVDVEDIVVLIANMIGELIETNDELAMKSGHLTRFHSRTAPGISVLDYLSRLAKHATLTPPLLLSMVYYIDRLCALYPDFTMNTLTVHRFLITAATVAAKGLSDSFWNNSTYARVGGVRVAELKLLELEFLYRVDWKIVPNPEVLVAYYKGLIERCPLYVLEGATPPSDEVDDEEDTHEGDSAESSASSEESMAVT